MKALFDITHPAHVHLFKNAIRELHDRGATVHVTSRDKEITTRLLDAYDIDHESLSESGEGALSLPAEWAAREVRMLATAREFDPDVIVGRLNPALVHASQVLGVPNVVFMDTEIKSSTIARVFATVTYPFIDVYCTPPGFERPNASATHHEIDFQELAYLHPDQFEPDPDVLTAHGIDPDDDYYVVRFAGWDAYHDVGYSGLSADGRRELVESLADRGDVYVSSETELPPDLAEYELPMVPQHVHHLLYYADLYVGDSGTMSSEAAILGTPAVRTNSMVADDTESIFRELEEDYGLLYSFADEQRALSTVDAILDGERGGDWDRKRERLLADKQDVTARMVELIGEAAAAPTPAEPRAVSP
ncbi:MAG: DUF354 domain-containing protein [Haloarculaceae archaeon]